MHNCHAPGLYEKDLIKFIDRWGLHPDVAHELNAIYQESLRRYETFADHQAKLMGDGTAADKTGRGRAESLEILAEFVQHMKGQARQFMDARAKRA